MKKKFDINQFSTGLQKDGSKKEIDSSEETRLVSSYTEGMFKLVSTDENIRKKLWGSALKVLNESWGKSINQ